MKTYLEIMMDGLERYERLYKQYLKDIKKDENGIPQINTAYMSYGKHLKYMLNYYKKEITKEERGIK